MTFDEIGKELGISKQGAAQTASRALKKLFKNTKQEYNLSYLETLEMLLKGLDIYQDDSMTKWFMKNIGKDNIAGIEKERKELNCY